MLGFRLPENFNFPYISQSISEFWRRWHITLGNWMRDYLYIPLGGNRVSKNRMYFNLWMVFLLSGLWHGAAWTFVVWGLWHGAALSIERAARKHVQFRTPRWIGRTIVLAVVGIGALYGAMTVDVPQARDTEDGMYRARLVAKEIPPTEHKRADDAAAH